MQHCQADAALHLRAIAHTFHPAEQKRVVRNDQVEP